MQSSTVVLLFALLLATLCVQHISCQCKTCFENGVYCINETSFHLCFDSKIDTSVTYTCPEGNYCTKHDRQCQPTAPACESVFKCGVCDKNKLFTCLTRTTFAQCNGTQIMNDISECKPGLVCDSTGGAICVHEAHQSVQCAD